MVYRTALTGLWGGFYCISRLVTTAHATLHFQTFRTMAWTQVLKSLKPQDSPIPSDWVMPSVRQTETLLDDGRTQDRDIRRQVRPDPILSRKAALRHSRLLEGSRSDPISVPTPRSDRPRRRTHSTLSYWLVEINTTMISTKLWKFMIQLPSIANGSLTLLQY